jgi:hypothetical protein
MAVVDDVDALASASVAARFCSTSTMVCPALAARSRQRLLHQVAHDDRRQPLERLVEQDDLRIAHQRARDRQHLLLAARQVGAAAAARSLRRGNIS